MINLSEIKKTKEELPIKILIYGKEGIGKSTFGIQSPNPLIIDTEGSTDRFECARVKPKSYQDFMDIIAALDGQDHEFKTVVVDTLDWLEAIIFEQVARENSKKSIEDIPYGRGYKLACEKWRDVLMSLDYLWKEKGLNIILIAHHKVKKFNNPNGESYDRYAPKLRDDSEGLVVEWAEAVMFADEKVMTKTEEAGFNKKNVKAKGLMSSLLYTCNNPAVVCKNRYGLLPEINFSWDEFIEAMNEAQN